MTLYLLCLVLFCIGIYCVATKRNLVKIIIGLAIAKYAINLFLVLLGYRMSGRSPILDKSQAITDMVDPLPQAVAMISIVTCLGVTALLAALAMRLYEKYGTFDVTQMRKLKG
ncbi:MAG: sodium:proton antiporter [Planctomycetota bacterium]